jgi:hypothetical protein
VFPRNEDRPATLNMTKLTILVFAMIVLSPEAFACTCAESYPPMSISMEKSDAVFIGKVVSVTKLPRSESNRYFDLMTTFRVERSYKGLSDSTILLSLKTNYNQNSCGYWVDGKPKPKVGQRWIAFAKRWENEPAICS